MRKKKDGSVGRRPNPFGKPLPDNDNGPSRAPTPPATVSPAKPTISPRRRFWFIVIIIAVIGILQESVFRYAFPLPEVEEFNRLNYTQTFVFGSVISENPKRGLANVRIFGSRSQMVSLLSTS